MRFASSHRQGLLAFVSLAALVAVCFVPRIPQDPAYHAFVDRRTLLGVPNFWNVFSNIGYLAVGIYGLARASRLQSPAIRPAYLTFCVAVTLVLGERVSWALSRRLLWPLVIIGVGTVLYWAWTEKRGVGDLRPYGLVQFLPVVLMPPLLLLLPGNRRSARWLWWTFGGYVVAKIAEQLDGPIYDALGLSGHSIKHFVSSVAVLFAVFAMLEMSTAAVRRAA